MSAQVTPGRWQLDRENNRLRDAAPELLAALVEMKELFRFSLLLATPDIARDGMEFIRNAEVLVAKARGEA